MSVAARRAIEGGGTLLLRTAMHPAAAQLESEGFSFETFDSIYESEEGFEQVYSRIADEVLKRSMAGDVVYCVPGHPLVGEESVRLIIERARGAGIETKVVGSESFMETCLEATSINLDEGIKIVDALSVRRHSADPGLPNLFYQLYDRTTASELKLALMDVYPDEHEVYLIIGAGTEQERVETIPLYELDRRDYDHLTAVLVPRLESR